MHVSGSLQSPICKSSQCLLSTPFSSPYQTTVYNITLKYHEQSTSSRVQSCTSLFNSLTSSPGLKAGSPIYGQPSHRNASPKAQLPHEPTLPCTVKSTSVRSLEVSFARLASASWRLALSSASIRCASPQVQSLQARRLFVLGLHASAGGY